MQTFTTHTTHTTHTTGTTPTTHPTGNVGKAPAADSGPVPAIASAPELRVLPGGLRPWDLRRARPRDEQAVLDFYDRLALESRYRRFHGIPGDRVVRHEAERVAHGTDGDWSWVAADYDGTVVGVVRLVRAADGDHEIAVAVDDAWTGQGVGRRLVRWALAFAGDRGIDTVVARIQGDNLAAHHLFRSLPGARATFDDGEILVTVPAVAPGRPFAAERRGGPRFLGRRRGPAVLPSETPAAGWSSGAGLRHLA